MTNKPKAAELLKGITPAPWQCEHRKGLDGMYRTEVFSENYGEIACLYWTPDRSEKGVTKTYRNKNAKLIAAAPQLASEVVRLEAQVKYQEETWATANAELEARGREIKRLEARVMELEEANKLMTQVAEHNFQFGEKKKRRIEHLECALYEITQREEETGWDLALFAQEALAKKEGE